MLKCKTRKKNMDISVSSQASNIIVGDVHHHYNNPAPEDTKELLEKVQQLTNDLEKQAHISTGQLDAPVNLGQALKPVSLLIKSNIQTPQELESKGQYRRRSEFESLFTVSSENINLDQLFLHAKRLANHEAAMKCRNPEVRQAWIETHSNIVGTIGHPGTGKTTLAKMLAQNVLQKLVLPETDMVFYIPLWLLNFSKEMSLVQFLLAGSYCRWDSNKMNDKFLLDHLERSNIVILFDALDEAKFDESSRVQAASCESFATADVFLKNILAGHLLPKAKKLLTSRPNAMFNLHPDYRPHCTVEILGLSRESQDDLCDQICGPDYSKQVKEALFQHPELSSFIHIPIYCIMTIACILENVQYDTGQSIISKTDVLLRVLLRYLRTNHSGERRVALSKLAQLAWSGLNSRTVVFSDDDLTRANVDREDFQAFLHTYVDDASTLQYTVLETDKKTSFSHLLWQEFLGSCHAMFVLPIPELKLCLEELPKRRWFVVTTFMYGLCNKQLFTLAKKVFPGISKGDWEERVAILKSLAVTRAGKIMTSLSEKAEFCRVCSWAQESQNREIVQEVASNLPETINLCGVLHPTEVSCMQTILKEDNTLRTLGVGQMSPRTMGLHRVIECADSGLSHFLEVLTPRVDNKTLQVPWFGLWHTYITEVEINAMKPLLPTLSEIVLLECDLQAEEAACISSLLNTHNKSLKKLDLSVNDIGDEGAAAVSSVVHLVKILFLRNCDISFSGAAAIAQEMAKDNSMVHTLNVSFNKIGDAGTTALAQNLRKFQSLDLHDCGLTENGMQAIGEGLTQCEKISLSVSGNDIGNEGIRHLRDRWHCLENIFIADCGLSEECIDTIEATMQQLKEDELNLYPRPAVPISSFASRIRPTHRPRFASSSSEENRARSQNQLVFQHLFASKQLTTITISTISEI